LFKVRIHGRGGQGVVTAAEMLSVAAFLDGHFAQAFPSFGSERMGAPVVSYCRIADVPIRSHDPVTDVDGLIIQDATLLHELDLFAGLQTGGFVIINSARTPSALGLDDLVERLHPERLVTVPGTELALRIIGRPLPNAVLLAALAEISSVVPLHAVELAIARRFQGRVADDNITAARQAATYLHETRGANA
jgi:pyruvate ferredoxin oxidoreductase gamma subunit